MVGSTVGGADGSSAGGPLGSSVGSGSGVGVGVGVGSGAGVSVGSCVGSWVGPWVGSCVGSWVGSWVAGRSTVGLLGPVPGLKLMPGRGATEESRAGWSGRASAMCLGVYSRVGAGVYVNGFSCGAGCGRTSTVPLSSGPDAASRFSIIGEMPVSTSGTAGPADVSRSTCADGCTATAPTIPAVSTRVAAVPVTIRRLRTLGSPCEFRYCLVPSAMTVRPLRTEPWNVPRGGYSPPRGRAVRPFSTALVLAAFRTGQYVAEHHRQPEPVIPGQRVNGAHRPGGMVNHHQPGTVPFCYSPSSSSSASSRSPPCTPWWDRSPRAPRTSGTRPAR